MKKSSFTRAIALAGTGVMLSFGLAALNAPAQAGVASVSAGQGSVSAMANACRYPTSARPGSSFVRSYSNCVTCREDADNLNSVPTSFEHYCTYNPSNNKNDLHLIRR